MSDLLGWMPLAQMHAADERYGKKLRLGTYQARWGVGQLLYTGLDVAGVSGHVDFERMNWDGGLGMDFATLSSILCTNNISLASWDDFGRMLELYRRSWKSRLALSLCCEAASKIGYVGMPLYDSEIWGYSIGAFPDEGFLDVLERDEEGAFDWMILRILDKISAPDLYVRLLEMLGGKDRELVYPFLLFGAGACASYRELERVGGRDAVVGPVVPHEVASEVYMMLVSCTATLMFYGRKPKLFSREELYGRLHVEGLTRFGADTSIRTSPHFVCLQGEIGHLTSALKGPLVELPDIMNRRLGQIAAWSSPDKERTFDRVTDRSPREMAEFVAKHRAHKHAENIGSRYHVSQEWLAEQKKPYFP